MRGGRPWLLLDLAGVLLDFAPERRLELIGLISGLTADAVQSRIETDGITGRLDTGQADGPALASFLSGVCGRSIDEGEAWRIWLSPFSVASAAEALPLLSDRYRLGVFTNNPRPIARLFDTTRFEAMLFSSELGMKKPDQRSYALVQARLRVSGDDLILVDDGEANVQGARRAGWRAVLYQAGSAEGLLAVLRPVAGPRDASAQAVT